MDNRCMDSRCLGLADSLLKLLEDVEDTTAKTALEIATLAIVNRNTVKIAAQIARSAARYCSEPQ